MSSPEWETQAIDGIRAVREAIAQMRYETAVMRDNLLTHDELIAKLNVMNEMGH